MKVLDSEINLDANKYLLFTKYRTLFLLLLISILLDALSTMYFMHRIGPAWESNFVVRVLSVGYGTLIGPILGKLYQLFGVWVITLFTPRLITFVCSVIISVNCYAVLVNMNVV